MKMNFVMDRSRAEIEKRERGLKSDHELKDYLIKHFQIDESNGDKLTLKIRGTGLI